MAAAFVSESHAKVASGTTVALATNSPADGVLQVVIAVDHGGYTMPTPSGWTLVAGWPKVNSDGKTYLFHKVASGEPSSNTWTFDDGSVGKFMEQINVSGADHVVDSQSSDNNAGSGTTATVAGVTADANGQLLITCHTWISTPVSSSSPPGDMTEQSDWTSSGTLQSTSVSTSAVNTGATGSKAFTMGTAALAARGCVSLIVGMASKSAPLLPQARTFFNTMAARRD